MLHNEQVRVESLCRESLYNEAQLNKFKMFSELGSCTGGWGPVQGPLPIDTQADMNESITFRQLRWGVIKTEKFKVEHLRLT